MGLIVKHIEGDLTGLHVDLVFHQCNCMNGMKRGLAKSLSDDYPRIVDADTKHNFRFTNKRDILGTVTFSTEKNKSNGKDLIIMNNYSQYGFKKGSNTTDLRAVERCMKKLVNVCIEKDITKIATSELYGCGLAVGNKEDIQRTMVNAIERELEKLQLGSYEIELYFVDYAKGKYTIY